MNLVYPTSLKIVLYKLRGKEQNLLYFITTFHQYFLYRIWSELSFSSEFDELVAWLPLNAHPEKFPHNFEYFPRELVAHLEKFPHFSQNFEYFPHELVAHLVKFPQNFEYFPL